MKKRRNFLGKDGTRKVTRINVIIISKLMDLWVDFHLFSSLTSNNQRPYFISYIVYIKEIKCALGQTWIDLIFINGVPCQPWTNDDIDGLLSLSFLLSHNS